MVETIKAILFNEETQVQTLVGSLILAVWLCIAAIVFFFIMGTAFILF